MTDKDENVIEVDFSRVPDRYSDHLSRDLAIDPDEIEVPPYWESEKGLDELYSYDSLTKAIKLARAGKVESAGREGLYQVHGSELYVCCIVEIEDSKVPGVTCTCPNGSNRSGRPTCYHSSGALLVYMNTDLDELEKKIEEKRR